VAQPSNDIEKAARFIALNKTCFNGLYRVNRKGQFNVPIGDYKNPLICDKTNLERISRALSKATVFDADYSNVTGNAKHGDFVYLDPPYDHVSSTSNFTGYTSNGFGNKNQEQLLLYLGNWSARGSELLVIIKQLRYSVY
jgi:DNA adenine methylase